MNIVDRYLTFSFIKIFCICFVSMVGLYIVIHLFTNLDEISAIASQNGGMKDTLVEFYGPRVLDFFDRMAGILVLTAGVFSIALMQRKREMTAIQAAGVGKFRVVRPVIILAVIIIGLSAVNREFVLPKYKDSLSRTARNWAQNDKIAMEIIKDHDTGILFHGEQFEAKHERIRGIVVQLPIYLNDSVSRLNANYGYLREATKRRPRGITLQDVTRPTDLSKLSSMKNGDKLVVYTPKDHPWLKPNQCHIVTELTLKQLAYGQSDTGYEKLEEMIASIKQPSQWYSRGKRIAIHNRIMKPALDLTLVLLGLPLIILQTNKNLFASAGLCVGVILLVSVSTLACQSLASLSIIKSAAFAAWLPVIVFAPLASLSMRTLRS